MFKLISTAAFALLCLCGSAFASDRINSDYRGADAGTLVFSTSALRGAMSFTFYYKRKGQDLDARSTFGAGEIDCSCVGFWHPMISDPDYVVGMEFGKVHIQHLPPGDYEVYTYGFSGTIIVASISWAPAHAFSLPFTIKSGQTTYIGNFGRAPSLGTPLEATTGGAGYFVVSDKHDRDIEIARKKDPNLAPVTISVTDVAPLGFSNIFANDPVPLPAP